MDNYIQFQNPVDVLEVAKQLYDAYKGALKTEHRMALFYEQTKGVFIVCDGRFTGVSGVDLFDVQATGSRISRIGSSNRVQADRFKVMPAQVDEVETTRIVAQINAALSGK